MSEVKDYRRYWCSDCGVKPQRTSRADKHRRKTGHRMIVDEYATQCAIDWHKPYKPTFYELVVARDNQITHDEGH